MISLTLTSCNLPCMPGTRGTHLNYASTKTAQLCNVYKNSIGASQAAQTERVMSESDISAPFV